MWTVHSLHKASHHMVYGISSPAAVQRLLGVKQMQVWQEQAVT